MRDPLPANVLELHPDPLRGQMARLDRLEEQFIALADRLANARPRSSGASPAEFWRELARNLMEERLERWGDANGSTYLRLVLAAADGCARRGDPMGLGDLVDMAEELADCRPLTSAAPGGSAA